MTYNRRADFIFEFKRKMFHFILGTCIAYAAYFLYPFYGNLIAAPLILAVITMLLIPRVLTDHTNHRMLKHVVYHFERERDIKTFPYKGAIFFGIGIIAPILFLPVDAATGRPLLACAIITVLAGGDAFSTLVGKFYGKFRIGHKSVEGFIVFIMFGYTMAHFLVSDEAAAALAIAGAFIEFFNKVDDNLAIPVGLTVFYHLMNIIIPNTLF
ncbi:MAG: hypothetical protein JW724_00075 [Candidatus Altiarchaeota archaeon]|nr:hypothetical protein [Candidatus Altiarchaeota archaeon]